MNSIMKYIRVNAHVVSCFFSSCLCIGVMEKQSAEGSMVLCAVFTLCVSKKNVFCDQISWIFQHIVFILCAAVVTNTEFVISSHTSSQRI